MDNTAVAQERLARAMKAIGALPEEWEWMCRAAVARNGRGLRETSREPAGGSPGSARRADRVRQRFRARRGPPHGAAG